MKTCATCDSPAACFGAYEHPDNEDEFACNDCCGHGNEDGWCEPCCQECGTIEAQSLVDRLCPRCRPPIASLPEALARALAAKP